MACQRVVEAVLAAAGGSTRCVVHTCPMPGCGNSKSSRSPRCAEHTKPRGGELVLVDGSTAPVAYELLEGQHRTYGEGGRRGEPAYAAIEDPTPAPGMIYATVGDRGSGGGGRARVRDSEA